MKNEPVKKEKYDTEVYVNEDMDEIRKDECLCLNCMDLGKCKTAKKGYELCVEENIAFMVTRCPCWKKI